MILMPLMHVLPDPPDIQSAHARIDFEGCLHTEEYLIVSVFGEDQDIRIELNDAKSEIVITTKTMTWRQEL